MSPVSFTQDQAHALAAQLPTLSFNAGQETGVRDKPLLDAYLGYYCLDFSIEYPGTVHAMGTIEAAGFRIATQYWLPPQAKGALVVVHGYYDHVGIYSNAIAYGLARGLAVLAFDLPGHGLSSGERSVIDSFDQYGDVLETLLERAAPLLPAPWFALGQSTGGAVLLNHLWRYESPRKKPRLSGTALCAPLVLPRSWGVGRIAYSVLHRFIQTLPRGRSCSSHDQDFIRFIDHEDCLQSRRLSVRWVGAMKRWDMAFSQYPPLGEKRLLVIQGTEDRTVAWHYNLKQISARLPAARVVMIDGAGHQLVNERKDFRDQVFMQIDRFFFHNVLEPNGLHGHTPAT